MLSSFTTDATHSHALAKCESSISTVNVSQPVTALLPIMASVLIAFLIIGLALPVLPLHVHQGLGLSAFVVGLVTGSQFAASLFSRVWAGRYADVRGPKRALVVGLLTAVVSGLLYLASLIFVGRPSASVSILVSGRALLGAAESFIITGAVSWGLALTSPKHAGRVIAWMGMAMFAALAFGAPLGTTLYATGGFIAVATAATVIPLITIALIAPLSPTAPKRGGQPAIMAVAAAVWMPGFGSALSTIGFGAMIGFSSLLCAQHGWKPVWLPFSAFAVCLVAARLLFSHLPDKLGGAKVALVCVFIEAAGLALIWFAPILLICAAGAALTGFGYSLVYPGLGAEAVRRAPPQSRGLAVGAYTVFLDVALGFGSPGLGLIAERIGLGSVFLASAIAVLGTAIINMRLVFAGPIKKKAIMSTRFNKHRQSRQMKLVSVVTVSLLLIVCPPAHAGSNIQEDVHMVAPALEKYKDTTLLNGVWKRSGLSSRDRSIVTLSALIARNQTNELPSYLGLALDSGVKPAEISEIITHLAFYAGWANATAAAAAAKDVFVARKIGFDDLPVASPSLLPLNEAAEAERAKRVDEQFGTIAPGLVQNTTDVLFRDLWLRPDLAPRDRSLVTVSALVATGQVAQISYHLGRAMDNGLTKEQAGEALTQLAFYAGWPNAFSALPVFKDVFERRPR